MDPLTLGVCGLAAGLTVLFSNTKQDDDEINEVDRDEETSADFRIGYDERGVPDFEEEDAWDDDEDGEDDGWGEVESIGESEADDAGDFDASGDDDD